MRLVTVSQTCLSDHIIVYPAGKRVHARVYASFVVRLVWIVYQEMHTVAAQRVVRRVRVIAMTSIDLIMKIGQIFIITSVYRLDVSGADFFIL
jgi:hypothetical protein